jgi:hypothetical protein
MGMRRSACKRRFGEDGENDLGENDDRWIEDRWNEDR